MPLQRGNDMGLPLLTAEQIQAALDLKEVEIDVPEWGGAIKVGALTVEERDQLIAECSENGKHGGRLDGQKMVRLVVALASRQPKLTEDILKRRSWKVVDRIANVIFELSGMKPEASVKADVTFRPES